MRVLYLCAYPLLLSLSFALRAHRVFPLSPPHPPSHYLSPLSYSSFVTFASITAPRKTTEGRKKRVSPLARLGPLLHLLVRWLHARVSSLTPEGTLNASPELPWRHPSSLSGPSSLSSSSSSPRRRSLSSHYTGLSSPLLFSPLRNAARRRASHPGFPYNLLGSRVALFFPFTPFSYLLFTPRLCRAVLPFASLSVLHLVHPWRCLSFSLCLCLRYCHRHRHRHCLSASTSVCLCAPLPLGCQP